MPSPAIFYSGGFVDRIGMVLVHQCEPVMSAGSTGAGLGRETGGINITINTEIVNQNLLELERQLTRVLGSYGRGLSPVLVAP